MIRTWTPEMVEIFLENPSVYPNINNITEDEKEEVQPRNRRSNHGF